MHLCSWCFGYSSAKEDPVLFLNTDSVLCNPGSAPWNNHHLSLDWEQLLRASQFFTAPKCCGLRSKEGGLSGSLQAQGRHWGVPGWIASGLHWRSCWDTANVVAALSFHAWSSARVQPLLSAYSQLNCGVQHIACYHMDISCIWHGRDNGWIWDKY